MANDLTSDPWFIDTQGATVLWPTQVRIRFVEWYNPAAAGDLMEIQDKNNKPIVKARAEVANGTQVFSLGSGGGGDWYNGLKVPVLTSGQLLIHID